MYLCIKSSGQYTIAHAKCFGKFYTKSKICVTCDTQKVLNILCITCIIILFGVGALSQVCPLQKQTFFCYV